MKAHLPITQMYILLSPILYLLYQNHCTSLPGSCELKGSKSPGAGAEVCSANAGRIKGVQPVWQYSPALSLPVSCHPFSPPVASMILPDIPSFWLQPVLHPLSLADLTPSAMLWQGPGLRTTTGSLGPSGNTSPADGDLQLYGEVLDGGGIYFSLGGQPPIVCHLLCVYRLVLGERWLLQLPIYLAPWHHCKFLQKVWKRKKWGSS